VQSNKPLPTLELGDSSDLLIGEPLIAVGNPLGFSHSVSSGILSALHRDLEGPAGQGTTRKLTDVIQTDCAINPGNSGGPLLNAYGQVIGINTAIRSDAQNIGFAIQVNRLRDLIPDLMSPEHVNKAELPIKLFESRRIIEPSTIQSTVLVEDTDEVVESIAGAHPRDLIDAYSILLRCKPGDLFDLVTNKGTKQIKVKSIPVPDVVTQARKRLGLTVEDMTPLLAGKLGIDQEWGVLVTGVDKESIADAAGLQKNDIIVQIGRYRVNNLEKFATLLQYLPKKGKVFVGIVRPGEAQMGRTVFNLGS
jgi:serine protease Do